MACQQRNLTPHSSRGQEGHEQGAGALVWWDLAAGCADDHLLAVSSRGGGAQDRLILNYGTEEKWKDFMKNQWAELSQCQHPHWRVVVVQHKEAEPERDEQRISMEWAGGGGLARGARAGHGQHPDKGQPPSAGVGGRPRRGVVAVKRVEKGEKHRISHPDDVRLHPATQSGLVFRTEVDSGN